MDNAWENIVSHPAWEDINVLTLIIELNTTCTS